MRRLTAFLTLLLIALPAGAAQADPFTVINTNDSGDGSLRTAIEGTNNLSGSDVITISATGAIELNTALPTLTEDVVINGPGAGSLTVERAAAAEFRIFDFAPSVTASLSGVTVSNGLAATGGGIANASGSLTLTRVVVSNNEAFDSGGLAAAASGGGVFSSGPLTLRESTVRANVATAEDQGFFVTASGGGVSSSGPLIIDRSTISENEVWALRGVEEVNAWGGGLRAIGEPTTIEQSTISGNFAFAQSNSAVASGGGIQGGKLTLTGSTVSGNFVAGQSEALNANLGLLGPSLVRNTIVADPRGEADSCDEPPGSGGFNLDEDGSCEFGKATDLAGVIAGIEPLAANGGSTPTHALRASSPALDRGNAFGSTIDQRGLPRPSNFATISDAEGGDGGDIGAFELQAPPSPASVLVQAVAGDRHPPNTRIVSGPPGVTYKREAKFRFAATEGQSTFQCKLDKRKWRGCRNPYERKVRPGKHLFKVRAIDRFGNVDPTPARFGWRVKALS